MARALKDYTMVSFKLESKAVEKMNEIHEETSLPKTAIMEKAIEKYYEEYKRTGRI